MKKKHILIIFTMVLMGVLVPLLSTKNVQAATPKLTKKSISMYARNTKKLYVKNNRQKKKVKWSSSNKAVVTVSKNGTVKAKKVGKATITAKVGKKKLRCKVTVKPALKIADRTVTIRGNGFIKLSFPYGKWYSVNYSIKDKSILAFDHSGNWEEDNTNVFYFNVKKTGTTYVTFTNQYDKESIVVKVNAIYPKITFPQTPLNVRKLANRGTVYSSASINNIYIDKINNYYENDGTFNINLKFQGTKTYDYSGSLGTWPIYFMLIIYDKDNSIVYSDDIMFFGGNGSIIVNQDFVIDKLIEGLQWNNNYRIELHDYSD